MKPTVKGATTEGQMWNVDVRGPADEIAVATFTRPPRNLMNLEGMSQLERLVDAVASDDSINLLILTGGVPRILRRSRRHRRPHANDESRPARDGGRCGVAAHLRTTPVDAAARSRCHQRPSVGWRMRGGPRRDDQSGSRLGASRPSRGAVGTHPWSGRDTMASSTRRPRPSRRDHSVWSCRRRGGSSHHRPRRGGIAGRRISRRSRLMGAADRDAAAPRHRCSEGIDLRRVQRTSRGGTAARVPTLHEMPTPARHARQGGSHAGPISRRIARRPRRLRQPLNRAEPCNDKWGSRTFDSPIRSPDTLKPIAFTDRIVYSIQYCVGRFSQGSACSAWKGYV